LAILQKVLHCERLQIILSIPRVQARTLWSDSNGQAHRNDAVLERAQPLAQQKLQESGAREKRQQTDGQAAGQARLQEEPVKNKRTQFAQIDVLTSCVLYFPCSLQGTRGGGPFNRFCFLERSASTRIIHFNRLR